MSQRTTLLFTTCLIGALLGIALVTSNGLVRIAAAGVMLVSLVIVVSPIREWAVLAWVLLAPFWQEAARAKPVGTLLNNGAYLFAGVGLVLWAIVLVVERVRSRRLHLVAFAPVALVAYTIYSLSVGDYFPEGWTRIDFVRQIYGNLILPVAGFYVLAWGFRSEFYERWWQCLWLSSLGVSFLAIAEHLTGFQLWGYVRWQSVDIGRSVGPFANPAVLGTYVGIALVSAATYLIWARKSPTSVRLATMCIVLGLPALWFTYARASLIAVGVAVLLVGALKSEFRFALLFASLLGVAVLTASWGLLSETSVVSERIGNVSNGQVRILMALWSLELFLMKPWVGWGYGSFDVVKSQATGSIADIPTSFARYDTSHNTLLTSAVELGVIGVVLTSLTWLPPVVRGVRAAFAGARVEWLPLGAVGVVFVYWVNASFIDMRFFSLPILLAFMALGMLMHDEAGEPQVTQ